MIKKPKNIIALTFLFTSVIGFGQSKKWTLEECVNHAIQHNISIKQSELDKQTSEIGKKDAFGNFLPAINGQVSHSWNMGLSNDPLSGVKTNQTTESSSAGLSASVDIYKGMRNLNQMRKAKMSIIASQYQLTKMQEDISLNVVNAYLQILFNKENLKVQQQQLQYDTKQMERTKELVDAGVIPKGDLMDVNATVATDNQRLIAAENALLISKLSLAQLLQLENFQDFDVVEENVEAALSKVLLEDPKAIFSKAKETRTELKLAETNLKIAEKDIQIAKGSYQPTLTGSYSIGTSVLHRNTLIDSNLIPSFSNQVGDNKGQTVALQLSIPILNGFSTRNNVSRSKIALERSKIALEQSELDLERTVYTAYTDTKGAQKSYEAAVTTLEARENSMNYAKERYEVGLMNIFDFNQAQTLYVNAQSEVLRTKYDYIFRTKILEFYFGIPIIKNK
ncbi:TolC family protein [Flavobacterium amniphilum]|uniref:TolC family protein n=1 Tax=Flavobacterium amniphilum TaxID=1834035 RepID=UPI00202AA0CE|nr:TolC family protein [Flavobacterium amniphilum]MCL9804835.1 TolC family protein [Flavobacterium amniphilum]